MERNPEPAMTPKPRGWVLVLLLVPALGFVFLALSREDHLRAGARAPVSVPEAHTDVRAVRDPQNTPAQKRVPVELPPPPEPKPTDATVSDPDLVAALNEESAGEFKQLYSRWSDQAEDKAATEDAQKFFDGAFKAYDLHPLSEYIRCGDSLCRGRFEYSDLKELYRMSEIQEADGIKVATTFAERHGDARTVSVYWSRDPHPEGLLTENGGQ